MNSIKFVGDNTSRIYRLTIIDQTTIKVEYTSWQSSTYESAGDDWEIEESDNYLHGNSVL